jgi:hypothetical protein
MVRQPSSQPSGSELANKHAGIDEQHEGNVIPHEALRRLSQDATGRLNLFLVTDLDRLGDYLHDLAYQNVLRRWR